MTAEQALELFEKCARPHLNKYFARNTCIEQTRILVEVLKRIGIAAEPLATKLHLVCAACGFQFFSSGDTRDYENAQKIAPGFKRRASDRPEDEHGYHTVALVERRILVDLTLAQTDSPEFGFRVEPFMLSLPLGKELAPDFLPDVKIEAANDDGVPFTVQWIGVPDRDWEKTPAWEPSHLWPLIDGIETAMWYEHLDQTKERWGVA